MTIPRILFVDDDAEMRAVMAAFLQNNGFIVQTAATGAEVDQALQSDRTDLILLDVMLEDESGVDICGKIRLEQDVPIIFVSTLSSDHQRMAGYDVGGDDYITKPFNPDLLLARVRAVLRRGRRSASLSYRRNTALYHFAGWRYNGKRDEVYSPKGFQVALSRRETELLKVLLANPHIPLTREEIAHALEETALPSQRLDTAAGRAIDVLVGRLRSKIEDDPKQPELIRTARGTGYILAADVDIVDG